MGDIGGFCSGCPKNCYGDLSLGPIVFEFDIALLTNALGEKAADYILNVNGYNFLKRKETSGQDCIFFDEQKICTMHALRPRDCRLFPFDVIRENGVFRLVLVCFCPNINNIDQEMVDKALEIVRGFQAMGELDVYASTKLAEVTEGGFRELPSGLVAQI